MAVLVRVTHLVQEHAKVHVTPPVWVLVSAHVVEHVILAKGHAKEHVKSLVEEHAKAAVKMAVKD